MDALEPSQCWELLRTQVVGRVAFLLDARLELLPVNYTVDRGSVVFRTGTGSKSRAADLGTEAVFEADSLNDPDVAWSVIIRGELRPIRQLHELIDSYDLPVYPWEASPKNSIVRLLVGEITGRSFPVADQSVWRKEIGPQTRAAFE